MSTIHRPNLRRPTYGSITQGTVFSCAHAARYEGCEVFGLAITARCDVAQQKYPVLNYLPVVSLADWLRRDGLDILAETEGNEQDGQLRKMLRQANVSETLPLSVPLERIAELNFPLDQGSKAEKAAATRFHSLVQEISEFDTLRDKGTDAQYNWFCQNRKPKVVEIVKRLSRHAVLGHYLFETLSYEGEFSQGYVCLLREVNTLPRTIAERLGAGLDRASYDSLCGGDRHSTMSLQIGNDDLAMPIAEIASPTMEHVLQVFSNLFGRIGIADPDEEVIGGIVDACVVESSGEQG